MRFCKQSLYPGDQKTVVSGLKADNTYRKKRIWTIAIQNWLPGVYQFPDIFLRMRSAAEQFNNALIPIVEKPEVQKHSVLDRDVSVVCPVDYLNSRRIIREAVIDSSGSRNKTNTAIHEYYFGLHIKTIQERR